MSRGGPYRLPPIVPPAPILPARPPVAAPSRGGEWLLPLVGVGLVVAWLLGFLAGAFWAGP